MTLPERLAGDLPETPGRMLLRFQSDDEDGSAEFTHGHTQGPFTVRSTKPKPTCTQVHTGNIFLSV